MDIKLPKRSLRIWQIRTGIVFLLLAAISLLIAVFTKWAWIAFAAVTVIAFLFEFVYLPKLLKSFDIAVGGGAVTVSFGVFMRITAVMPYPKLIFAEAFSSPLARLMKLSSVTLKAAKSRIIIPEIDGSDCENLLKFLSEEQR